jgi:hypothetical protein
MTCKEFLERNGAVAYLTIEMAQGVCRNGMSITRWSSGLYKKMGGKSPMIH